MTFFVAHTGKINIFVRWRICVLFYFDGLNFDTFVHILRNVELWLKGNTCYTYLLIYLLTYLLTYLITYLLTYLITYLFTYLLITYLLAYLLTYLLTYLPTYLLT